MPDWLMFIVYVGAIFGACVFFAALGLNGKPGAVGCGAILFGAVVFWTIWHAMFGRSSFVALIALVVIGGAAISGYSNWKKKS